MARKRGYSRSRVGSPRFALFNDPARYVYSVVNIALVCARLPDYSGWVKAACVVALSAFGDKMAPRRYNLLYLSSSARSRFDKLIMCRLGKNVPLNRLTSPSRSTL